MPSPDALRTLIPAWVEGRLEPVEKLDVHRRGLRHKAVSVFVLFGDEVLIQRRAAGKYHTPNLWANTCCTHPLWDESPRACAARRLGEELGLRDLPLVWRDCIEYRAEVGQGLVEHEVVDVFVSRPEARPDPVPDPSEVAATRWITLPALAAEIAAEPERFTPWLRIYLARHADSIFGQGDALAARGPR